MKKGEFLYSCFVDLKKAFDSIWWNGLFFKMLSLGISSNFFTVIKNMYQSVRSCVKTKCGLTPLFDIWQGVKQGEVLSPTVFNLYLHDLAKELEVEDDNSKLYLGDTSINCLLYADDLVLLSKTREGLQKQLHNLDEYCKKWSLKINLSKTKILIFNKNGKMLFREFFLGTSTSNV